ncbi:hypothetical protein BCD67_16375 [Oscillatoriales cyanobacterium USR001]|jgi:hypothetical protein|nr:hypothetical protein BCD67_16375 [Oscillatoriales cyanobacterium USR001]
MTPKESNDTNTVEVDGIRFEILVPKDMLTLPPEKPGSEVSVQIGIQITNNTLTPFRFSFYASLIPELLMPNERIVRGDYSTTFLRRRFESDFPLTMPGENVIFFPHAKLLWIKRKVLGLKIAAGDGGSWIFDNLTTATYKVRFILSNQNAKATVDDGVSKEMKLIENVWSGTMSTPFMQFNLVKLHT